MKCRSRLECRRVRKGKQFISSLASVLVCGCVLRVCIVCVCVCIVCVNDAGNATLFELLFECKTQLSNVIYQQKIFVTRPAVTLCIVIARQTLNYSKSV